MRSLIVRLMEGEKVLEETMIMGDNKWMERYSATCKDYCNKLMTNDRLQINIRTIYN